jgi:hypothetical protein
MVPDRNSNDVFRLGLYCSQDSETNLEDEGPWDYKAFWAGFSRQGIQ